jgi:EAL domain-containing protein (putative c-di-GMP-specific phosphodiesterase class I)
MSQSVGVRRTFDAMLQQADLALFDAKANGGNRTSVFRPELADKSSDFLRYETELKDALKANRLELYFQPKVSLEYDRVVGAEALLRLHTEDGRLLFPNDFIPVAEATGLINELGRWVLEDAARQHLALRKRGVHVELSVNVSPKQFLDPNFVPLLRSFLSMPDFEPEQFELEITEAVLLADDNRLKLILNEVTDMGYRLSIDDFGTAYANMASLQRYPIHCIKIDRSLFLNENHEILALSVINIAKALKVKVVAEGVETTQVRDWLYENGCDEYQGYLFSEPVPYDAFVKRVESGI